MKLKWANFNLILLFLVILTCGCASLRTDCYRGETRYRYNRGCQHYKQGDYKAAREAFENVLALDPKYGPAHGALGNLALIEGGHKAAMAHYQAAVQTDPGLEPVLRAFIMAATAQAAREPIIKAGIDLHRVYELVMADKPAELEALLSKEVPLDLLAKDTLSVTPVELDELREKGADSIDLEKSSVRYRLFWAYFLFYSQKSLNKAATLIEHAVPDAKTDDRKKAYVILGQIRERSGDFNLAVDAYLMAVDAGVSPNSIAHHLARIYDLDVESVMVQAGKQPPKLSLPSSLQIDLSLPAPKAVSPAIGFERFAPEIEKGTPLSRGAPLMF